MAQVEVESVKVKGTVISDLLKEDFAGKVKGIDKDIDFIALVMMKNNGKDLPPTLILFNHQSSQEIGEKTMHVNCADPNLLEKIIKLVKPT